MSPTRAPDVAYAVATRRPPKEQSENRVMNSPRVQSYLDKADACDMKASSILHHVRREIMPDSGK